MISAIDEGTRLRGGRYTLESRLGRGGAATVWLAQDSVLERPVAVKVLSEAFASDENWLARFSREARMAAGLTHPNLVSVYDFDADSDRPYIVMAHMPGGSLWDRMQAGEGSDPERLTRDLLAALDAIHSAGIVHRDIKPGNVLFDAGNTACLTDFGVARPEDATSLTQTGQIPGTGKFMAPELWRGEPADERSDLYAAGVVLREAIGNDAPPEVRALTERLAAEDASDRPASASAALAELDGGVAASPQADPEVWEDEPTPRTVFIQPEKRSHRGPAIAGLALLAVVAIFAIAQAIGGDDEDGSSGTGGDEPAAQANQNKPESDGNSGSGSSGSGESGSGGSETVSAPADGAALNEQGYALLQAGDVEGALPILERAVNAFDENSTDINYAYALYNYADALMQAGRPEEAIPYLEKRLEWDDQVETVQATLDEAYAAAGEDSSGEGSSSEGSSSNQVPPGQAKKEKDEG